ncbi:tetratricopeptide repeat protein [Rhizobium pisi]|uniref:Tetratricopeptide repeat protein n=1 Tax=Rhizobium pisi TaxID=574561 RepID=A0A427N1Q2_9HYPH|nr:tetratricopeptide repeat protein [Rhizobium pisi]TCA60453.1 tetratricopeptide repeat protein [Rhizobium pisi]
MAAPGGIAISDRIHDDVAGKVSIEWQDGGEISLKNIVKPVRVWFSGGRPGRAVKGGEGGRPSVAVLPFLGGAGDETLCDGFTEDIINGLARFRSLYVSGRYSSFAFKDSRDGIESIARKLGVTYVVEGSVRRPAERLRVTARLLDAEVGVAVWAERYDRPLTDIFDIQDEIANTIVGTLAGRIETTQTDISLRKPPASLAAYDLHLRGLSRFRAYDVRSNQDAATLFQQAIDLDPEYAQAHSFLALSSLAAEGYGAASKLTRTRSVALARKAVEMSSQDATCQRLLGQALLYDRDYDMAEHHARRAIELNPNDADCLMSMGYLLVQRGRPVDALAFMDQAVRLNPFHPLWYFIHMAAAHFSLGQYDQCVMAMRKLPDPQGWFFRLAGAYAKLGMQRDAAGEAEKVLAANPHFSVDAFMSTAILLEKEADRESLRNSLLLAGLPA